MQPHPAGTRRAGGAGRKAGFALESARPVALTPRNPFDNVAKSRRRSACGERIRRGRHRRRHRRIPGGHPGRAARPARGGGRAAEGAGGHLPDLGLHPDQGAHRARPRAENRAGGEGMGTDPRRRGGRHRHDPGAGPQGPHRDGPDEGSRVPLPEEQDRLDQGHRPPGRQRERGGDRRTAAGAARGEGDRGGDRIAASKRPRRGNRPEADHHER